MFGLNRDKTTMDHVLTAFAICLILQLHAVTLSRGESQSESLLSFLQHFTVTRSNWIDPAATQRARDVIVNTFQQYGMITWIQEFASDNRSHYGKNIVGQLNGRYKGSRDDKILVIGAHYDTNSQTPGVDDNGSGVAALLQIAKQLHSTDILSCQRDYTLQLVAFDLSENQPCARIPPDGFCGSYEFIKNLTQSLNETGALLQGAFIMDTIMNHNMTSHSQQVHPEMRTWFPLQYFEVQRNNFRGDFVEVIGQISEGNHLLTNFSRHFAQTDKFRVLVKEIELPVRPSEIISDLLKTYAHFFRSDHYRFWDNDPPLNAVYISDTADYRGHMISCYHSNCDDMAHVTEDMLVFLGKTTDALVAAAQEMTRANCQVKNKVCDREWSGPDGEFQSPSYPDSYPNSLSCQWLITGPPEHFLTLLFVDVELENSVNCTNDFVEVRDGNGSSPSSFIGRFCGSRSQVSLNSSSQSVTVVFQSDAFVTFKGFKVTWSSHPIPRHDVTAGRRNRAAGLKAWIDILILVMVTVLVFTQ